MKNTNWKSFAIGVLLTTTVMLGTGAATSTSENWDAEQQWETKLTSPKTTEQGGLVKVKPLKFGFQKPAVGWEPFQALTTLDSNGDAVVKIVWRKRIK